MAVLVTITIVLFKPACSQHANMELFQIPQPNLELAPTSEATDIIAMDSLQSPFNDYRYARVRGYLVPSMSGYYKFQFDTYGPASFYLSQDSTAYHKKLAWLYQWFCCPQVYFDSVYLETNKPCYFEIFGGIWRGSQLRLQWMLPDENIFKNIYSNNLRPAPPKPRRELVSWDIFHDQPVADFLMLRGTDMLPSQSYLLDTLNVKDFKTSLDFFSSRIRGYLIPPVSGNYTFCFAADDQAQFFLSPDTSSAGALPMNNITSLQPDWNQSVSAQNMVADERYYFEILHHDSVYKNILKLGWKFPGDLSPVVISSSYMTSFYDSTMVSNIRFAENHLIAYPNFSLTPGYDVSPWNADNKDVQWLCSNTAVAGVTANGTVSTIAPGECLIVVRSVQDTTKSDTLVLTVTDYPGPYFVKQDAAPNGDGHSWDNAISLTAMLDILNQGSLTQQTDVFIAGGVYKPTATLNRNNTFLLNNLNVMGGFDPTLSGTDTANHDYLLHETIFSGEIGIPGETMDNSYHVVTTRGHVTIEGITIRDGRANSRMYGPDPVCGECSIGAPDNQGGGIYMESPGLNSGLATNLVLINCRVTNNSAFNSAGGIICNYNNDYLLYNLTMEHCMIDSNRIQQNIPTDSGMIIIYVNGFGAGISFSGQTLRLNDCRIFYNNTPMGMSSALMISGSCMASVENSSIFNNSSPFSDVCTRGFATLSMNNSTLKGRLMLYGVHATGNLTNSMIIGGYNRSEETVYLALDNTVWTGVTLAELQGWTGGSNGSLQVKYSIVGHELVGEDISNILSNTIPDHTFWLDTLAFNGGTTPTMKLKNIPANPAKTHGNPVYLGTPDQRGYTRTDTVSIGAYQWTWPSQITINPQQAFIAPGDSLPFSVTVLPAWADDKTWSASASDSTIVGIAANTMLAQSEGNALVMVRTNDGNRRDTCFVMVMTDSVGVNGIVHNGNSNCYSALDVITVAGNGTSFVMQPGSNSEMIAGEKILYLPGTTVKAGGFMHGYIAPQGPWCAMFKESATGSETEGASDEDEQGRSSENGFRVYPNPTTGSFIVDFETGTEVTPAIIQCYDLMGDLIMEKTIHSGTKHELTLEGRKPGIYLLRLIQENNSVIKKIIKQ